MPSGVYIRTEKHKEITRNGILNFYKNGGVSGMKNKKHTRETKEKQSNSHIDFFKNGGIAGMANKKHTEEVKLKMSIDRTGIKYPNRKSPPPFSEIHKNNISNGLIGNKNCIGRKPWNIGLTKETNKIMMELSNNQKGKKRPYMSGKNHHGYKGGIAEKQTLEYKEKTAGRKKPEQCDVCGEIRTICFDHDHITEKFRGWICHRCNLVLGHVKDSSELLIKLSEYIKNSKKQ